MTSMKISIGGEGEVVEIPLTISGCACRVEDFRMALVAFTKEWRKAADTTARVQDTQKKPCGCKDK